MSVPLHRVLSTPNYSEFLQFIIRHYGHALEYGCKYLYQCMPRLLTLWLDFGCKVPDSVSTGKKCQEKSGLKTVQQLNEIIQTMMEHLPPYQYLIAFPQLISRICHPNSDVFAKLEAIIMRLLQHYPQQCLWMMIAVNKSTHHDRRERCRRILDKAKKQLPGMGKLIDDAVKLTDKLLDVCNKPAEPSKNYTMDKICHSLMRLTTNPYGFTSLAIMLHTSVQSRVYSVYLFCSEFSCIMVPLQSSLTVTLPAGAGSSGNHNAFPGFQPTIERFEDKVY
jgi:serine/threonine-protein kinase ATR